MKIISSLLCFPDSLFYYSLKVLPTLLIFILFFGDNNAIATTIRGMVLLLLLMITVTLIIKTNPIIEFSYMPSSVFSTLSNKPRNKAL